MKLLVLLVALFCVAAARAERIISIDSDTLSYTGALNFKSDSGAKNKSDRDTNEFGLKLNFAQTLTGYPQLMFKGIGRYERQTVDYGSEKTNSIFALSGGLLYNVDHQNIANSIFAGFQFGFEHQKLNLGSSESGLNLTLGVEAGKRWDMGKFSMTKISYAPTVEFLVRRYGGDIRSEYFTNGTELKLNFLKFDVLF